jgi:hypothetical protein
MKRCLITLLTLCISLHTYAPLPRSFGVTVVGNRLEIRKARVLRKIVQIERPRNSADAHRAYLREGAVGILQIREIMVGEVNRILGERRYFLSDRTDSVRSVEMFFIYQNFHNPQYNEQEACFLWCGGSSYRRATPKGWGILRNYWRVYRGSNGM